MDERDASRRERALAFAEQIAAERHDLRFARDACFRPKVTVKLSDVVKGQSACRLSVPAWLSERAIASNPGRVYVPELLDDGTLVFYPAENHHVIPDQPRPQERSKPQTVSDPPVVPPKRRAAPSSRRKAAMSSTLTDIMDAEL